VPHLVRDHADGDHVAICPELIRRELRQAGQEDLIVVDRIRRRTVLGVLRLYDPHDVIAAP
jgi:hypothetical protein